MTSFWLSLPLPALSALPDNVLTCLCLYSNTPLHTDVSVSCQHAFFFSGTNQNVHFTLYSSLIKMHLLHKWLN